MIRSPAGFDGGDRIKRYLDYYQPSYGVMMLSAGQFSPASLFAAGEQGVWYDPSDFSTMFQDAAGTTPVTAVEQPVGLLLDKSKGLALGAELVTNGTFDSTTTGWTAVNSTLAVSSGTLQITADGVGQARASQTVTTVTGLWYEARATVWRGTGAVNVDLLVTGIASSTSVTTTTPTEVVVRFAATGASTTIRVGSSGTALVGTTYFADNISVKALAGNHASQSTAASRPVLSARVNLLTQTDLLISPWAVFNTTRSTVAETPPIGGSSAAKLVVSSTASNEKVLYTASPPTVSAASHIASVYAKAAEMSWIYLRCDNGTATGCYFNLTAGTKGTEDAGVVGTITSVGGGWYRCTATKTLTSGSGYGAVQLASGDGGKVFGGTLNQGVLLAGADLRPSNQTTTLPAYQRVAAATDYDTSGFPLYLKFDGTDDSLSTGTIDPGAVDKAQVFAGVRKLSDAAQAMLVENSTNAVANSGTFVLRAPPSASATYGWFSWGASGAGTSSATSAASYSAPVTNVVAGIGDIGGDLAALRINGAQVAQSTSDQGTGNYLAYPLYIGRRNNATLPFNGQVYSMIVRFSAANLSNAQIASTETWVNGKTGAF